MAITVFINFPNLITIFLFALTYSGINEKNRTLCEGEYKEFFSECA